MKKFISILLISLLLIGSGFIYFKYYFVFGEGVKSGELNYMVRKGILFKTYEGKLIQSGFRASKKTKNTGIQSYEFKFSVKNKSIADSLMLCSGQNLELHYKEYNGALPWRGVSEYVVDKIISINEIPIRSKNSIATP